MFRARWFGWWLFALSLSQASCVASTEPLSDPATSEVDTRLFGQWKGKEEDGFTHYIAFGRPYENTIEDCPSGLMIYHQFTQSAKFGIADITGPTYFFVTKIGKDAYMNDILPKVKHGMRLEKWDRKDVESFMPIKYAVTQDRLTIWLIDPIVIAKVVERGKLKGEVARRQTKKDGPRDGDVQSVLLKDSTENLVNFLKTEGNPMLFSEKKKFVLDRVK